MSESNLIKSFYIQNKKYFNYTSLKYLLFGSITCCVSVYSYNKLLKYHQRKLIKNSISIIEEELKSRTYNEKEKALSKISSFFLTPQIQITIKDTFFNVINDKNIQIIFIKIANGIIKDIMNDKEIQNEIKKNIKNIFLNENVQNGIIDISKNILMQKNTQDFLENGFINFLKRPKINACFSEMFNNCFSQVMESDSAKDKISEFICDSINKILPSSGLKWKLLKQLMFHSWFKNKSDYKI